MDTAVLNNITYGMYIVSTTKDQEKVGCIINTLTQITSKDSIVTISLNKDNYTNKILKWPIQYYKHTITPLTYEEIENRQDKDILLRIKASLSHLEINGPNTILGVLPNSEMLCVCDSKKLRPVVIGRDNDTVIMTSEVNGINDVLPNRDITKDIYPNEKETIIIKNDLTVERWQQ